MKFAFQKCLGLLEFENVYEILQCTNYVQMLFQVVGYLNLLANSIDNFTHGLAVAGSFIVSTKVSLPFCTVLFSLYTLFDGLTITIWIFMSYCTYMYIAKNSCIFY